MTDNYESAGCLIDKRNITHPPRKKKKSSASRGCHVVIVCSAVNAVQCSAVQCTASFSLIYFGIFGLWNSVPSKVCASSQSITTVCVCMDGSDEQDCLSERTLVCLRDEWLGGGWWSDYVRPRQRSPTIRVLLSYTLLLFIVRIHLHNLLSVWLLVDPS